MSDDDDLRPTAGARFLLERQRDPPAGGGTAGDHAARATYRAAVITPDAVFASIATLADDGSVELPATGAPAELDAKLLAQAKLVARDAAKRRDDGLPPWPARILRWRA